MRIRFAGAYLPYPPDSGGRTRTYHLLRWAAERHEVHLLAFYHHPAELAGVPALERMCASVRTLPAPPHPSGPLVRLRRALFAPADVVMPRRSAEMTAALADARTFDLFHFDDLGMATYARISAGVPTVLSKHNVEAALYRQLARRKRPLSPAWALAWLEALALARHEGPTAALFRQVIVVSESERSRLARRCPAERIAVVPNGVDTSYFAPRPGVGEEPDSVVFVGAMFWPPNADAARWLVEDLLPPIRREVPDVQVYVVGHDPPPAVRALARQPGVVVTGSVPDVRPYLARGAVCVVPLRTGGGTRLKVLEALAMGRAVVSTSVGAGGLELADGRDVVIADGAEAFAAAVVGLLHDPARRSALGAAGRQAVKAQYRWETVLGGVESLYEGLRLS